MHLLSRAWEKTNYKTNMAIRINRNKKVPYHSSVKKTFGGATITVWTAFI